MENSISFNQLLAQTGHCLVALATYIAPCLAILLPIRFLTKIPSFIFRKLLHFVAFTCVTMMIISADSWQAAAFTSILIAVGVYPVLSALEGASWYSKLFVQKSQGETKRSLLLLFFMFAVLISVAWGIFDRPLYAAAAILMWGNGDAVAALIGVPLGRHKVQSRFTDGKKSWEGSAAMLLVSFACGFLFFLLVNSLEPGRALWMAAFGAVLGTATELFSPSEYDTVTVPAVILTALLIAAM